MRAVMGNSSSMGDDPGPLPTGPTAGGRNPLSHRGKSSLGCLPSQTDQSPYTEAQGERLERQGGVQGHELTAASSRSKVDAS